MNEPIPSLQLWTGNSLAWVGAIAGNLMTWVASAQSIVGLVAICLAAAASFYTIRLSRANLKRIEDQREKERGGDGS